MHGVSTRRSARSYAQRTASWQGNAWRQFQSALQVAQMLVWGDRIRTEDAAKLARIRGRCADAAVRRGNDYAGVDRRRPPTEAGELAQGLADALLLATGRDARSKADAGAMALLARIAAAMRLSWDSGFAHTMPVPEAELLARLREHAASR